MDKLKSQLVDVTMQRNKLRYACEKALEAFVWDNPETVDQNTIDDKKSLAIRYLQKALSETAEGAGQKIEKDGNTVV